jgi:hypothetical protein
MTVKERFKKLICKNFTINQLENIADDYAIEFAFWLLTEKDETKTLREMLEKFKNEKGL